MVICFRIGEVEHCYEIPIIEFPFPFPHPGPGPVNFPQLIRDAILVASLQSAAQHAYDDGVRAALAAGMNEATEALRRRAGDHVRIHEEAG
jgi:hypothetical protein